MTDLDRRAFLKPSAMAAAAAMILPSLGQAADPPPAAGGDGIRWDKAACCWA